MPSLNNLAARVEEQCPSNWDFAGSREQFIVEIGLVGYIPSFFMDPIMVTRVGPVPGATLPSIMEPAEPMMEPTSTPQEPKVRGYLPSTKERVLILPPQ